jgi:hypothetical protein
MSNKDFVLFMYVQTWNCLNVTAFPYNANTCIIRFLKCIATRSPRVSLQRSQPPIPNREMLDSNLDWKTDRMTSSFSVSPDEFYDYFFWQFWRTKWCDRTSQVPNTAPLNRLHYDNKITSRKDEVCTAMTGDFVKVYHGPMGTCQWKMMQKGSNSGWRGEGQDRTSHVPAADSAGNMELIPTARLHWLGRQQFSVYL